ncbi:MFS transporter [uncultured Leifsonia sp.]|uniref:MFS transporter n=1 Tax=uncultured Leifsonia sp. TaxID=340359 RepID=UPI0028D1064D|nr:MFS transporter [uncultured Leifsonia sp.]
MTSSPPSRSLAPLYLAGFTTAFGAHGVATALGVEAGELGMGLLTFGFVLALYDLAEVVLKPVFGALSDRIGVKPVIVGGLAAFVVASSIAIVSPTPLVIAIARLGQGAAASAFSPASSSAVARLAGSERLGRYFGRYGAWKSIGYAAGPLLGAALVGVGGIGALSVVLAALAAVAAVWVALGVPALPVLPRPRYTLADLVRQTADRGFLLPTLALATTTGLLGVAVGYLPLLATRAGLPALVSGAAVAMIAVVSAVAQPLAGRAHDRRRLTARIGVASALAVGTVALVLMVWAHPVAIFVAALLVGLTVGVATPLAYSHLAATTPEERMGRTMGNAELGREVGDAGGPLLVGAIGAAAGLPLGLGALAALTAASAVAAGSWLREA